MADDPYDLERFVVAQEGIYQSAVAGLRRARKTSHWTWFVFPQCEGLGTSSMSRRCAIRSAPEARAYLEHGILGRRLRECTDALNAHRGARATDILGEIDTMKLRSSLTLFDAVGGEGEPFATCLGGGRDGRTLAWLSRQG